MEIEVLDRLLSNLKSYVRELKRLSKLTQDEFLGDPDKLGSAKYHLIIAIECCLDLAHHIISSEGLRRPEDFADAFKVLAENEIINQEMLPKLEGMARFRNLLVHIYSRVDNTRVYEVLQSNLGDFDYFARVIINFLRKK